MRHLAIVSALALAVVGCKHASKTKAAPAATAADDHHTASVEKLDQLAQQDDSAAESMRTIAGRLEYEAGHRPAAGIKAEAVFSALAKSGVPITDGPRQYVAMVAGADYCVGGQTADGLGVSVCEYDTAAKAADGKKLIETRYAALNPVRDIVVRGTTTLTLTARPDAPLASSKRTAVEAFNTL